MALDPQLTTALISIAAAAITALGGWSLSILERKLGIDKDDRAKAVVEGAFQNGVALATAAVVKRIDAGAPLDKTAALNAVVTGAAAYAGPKVETELKRLGVDPSTITDRIAARVAASPAAEPAITDALNAAQLKGK